LIDCAGSLVHRRSDPDDHRYLYGVHQRHHRHSHLGSDVKNRQVRPWRATRLILQSSDYLDCCYSCV